MSDSQAALEQRLVNIETKLGFSEDLLETLNHTVFRQQEQIDRLQELVLRLHAQLSDLRESAPRSANLADEVPPHY